MNFRLAFLILLLTATGVLCGQHVTDNFKKDISYLASDELGGRLTGSAGEKLSAEYIAASFKAAGLKPYHDTTFQTFDIVRLRIATSQCQFKMYIGDEHSDFAQEFKLFEDYYPVSESSNTDSASAEILYVGYGIEAEKDGHNDYEKLDAEQMKGKIFAIKVGYPGDDTMPHSALAAYAGLANKIKTAKSHGAVGVIFTPGSKQAGEPKGELDRNGQTYGIPAVYFKKPIDANLHMSAKLKMVIGAPTASAHNVYGYRNNHKRNTVIICAHHDHLGLNEYNNSLYKGPQAIHNGADDNASGVAAMLQLARDLKGRKYKKNNYLFVAFSGEELGLLGSKYFVQNSPIPMNKINYVVNIDMLGRLDSSKRTLIINGTGTSPVWEKSLSKTTADSNLIRIHKSESGLGPSDHASFYLEGVPVLHFFTGQHQDYHKPSDDEEKINYAGMEASYQVMLQVIKATNKAGKLPFTKTKDVQPGRTRFKVTLGVMPDYSFTGEGMRLDAVTEGKAAAKAGLMKGDIVIRLGDYPVNNVQDYTSALGKFNKGDKTTVTYMRDDTSRTTEIEF